MGYIKGDIPKVSIDRIKIGGKELAEEVANNILNGNFDLGIEKIAKDIAKRQDNTIAMEFTKCIGELLKKNGVKPKITEYTHENVKEHSIEQLYGVSIDELDFTEHDKVFEDKIAKLQEEVGKLNQDNMRLERKCVTKDDEIYRLKKDYETVSELLGKYQQENESLKQRIAELESKENIELPFDPLECANYLINATYERETNSLERGLKGLPEKVNSDRYTIDDLEQIAEHLLVYCKHNKESE